MLFNKKSFFGDSGELTSENTVTFAIYIYIIFIIYVLKFYYFARKLLKFKTLEW